MRGKSTPLMLMVLFSCAWPMIPLEVEFPFAYLEDIHMRFMKNYGRVAHSALAYAMNDEFARVLHHQMEYFSSNQTADTLNRLRGEVREPAACAGVEHGSKPRPSRRASTAAGYNRYGQEIKRNLSPLSLLLSQDQDEENINGATC
ncbi:hypothetical protein M5K25_007684 [Dendrobium thyrsiflorum]|uniref:Longin domain-containing protein n=1 Tax=Dendrobium thyrsiflorum TaxID=117978 RepID=A0ABD0VFA2_DENTH